MSFRYIVALRWRLWMRWLQHKQCWKYGHIPRWQLYTLWRHIAAEHQEGECEEAE